MASRIAATPENFPQETERKNESKKTEQIEACSSNVTVFSKLPEETLRFLFSFIPFPANATVRFVCTDACKLMDESMFSYLLEKMRSATKEIFHEVEAYDPPHLDHFNKVMKSLFLESKDLIDDEHKEKVISELLKEMNALSLSPAKQNYIIKRLIEIWKKQPDEKLLINLLKRLFLNKEISNTIKLHLLSKSNIRKLLADQSTEMNSIDKGIIMTDTAHFKLKEVEEPVRKVLSISPKNRFSKNELVAVDHRGSLLENRRCTWYGIVGNIQQEEGKTPVYTVYTDRFVDKKQVHWLGPVEAVPEMLGKIPPEKLSQLPSQYLLGINSSH